MRPVRLSFHALILIGLLTFIPLAAAPSYLPGVEQGNWAKYGSIFATWRSDIPNRPPPGPIAMLLETDSVLNNITDVSGSIVTVLQTFRFTNGTSRTATIWGSVADGGGSGLEFWILSAGLSPGDNIYNVGTAPQMNGITTQAFAGALREAVVLNQTLNYGTEQYSLVGLWDRPTGILLSIAFEFFSDLGGGQTASGRSVATLTETNLWSTGESSFTITANPATLILTQPATGTLVGLSTITLMSFGNFSGEVFIGAGISPNVVNGPTAQVNPETVTLSPGGLATSTMSILVLPDTVPGIYSVNVTAHSLESRTVFIQLTIYGRGQPDFAIDAIPNPTPLPAGIANFTAIVLTSISGFSETVQLSTELAYNNVPNGSISFELPLANVTLPPNGQVLTFLELFVTANSTGTFGVRVTGTSGNLTRETIVDVIIVQQPPPINHPPIAAISYSPFNPTVGMLVSFNGINSFDPDGFIASYQWNFGDNATDSGPFVSHAYFAPGDYFATLTVTDNQGATGTASAIVHVSQQFSHDVAIVDIQLTPATVVAGQSVNLFIILQNQGSQAETVSLTVSANGHIIASRSDILISPQDPYGGFVYLTGNTTGLAPGTYTIAATVFLPTDEDPSDNTLLDGPLTVLPPPTISVTPDSGALATTVTVHGTGFPQPPTGFISPPILVSFDDMFIGFTLPSHGQFDFVFGIPHSEPGSHLIKALDAFSGIQVSTDFTVLESPHVQPESRLDVSVTTGPLYFRGETAVVYVLTSVNGLPQSQGLQVQATLYKPGGTTQQLSLRPVGTGVYLAEYSVPRSGSDGTYAVVATATFSELSSSGIANFQVKPTWISANGPRIASSTVAIGGILAAVGIAWRKGYFRKSAENETG